MADGIEKNIEVVKEEIADWRQLIKPHKERHKAAKWLTTDWKRHKLHTGMNLVTESVRLMPRLVAYYLVYSTPVWIILLLV